MRSWVRDNFGISVGVLLAFATTIGGVSVLVPDLRDWLGQNPGLAWIVAFLALVILAILWIHDDRALAAAEQDLRIESQKRQALEDARVVPTPRDIKLFQQLLDHFPWEEGVIPFLRYGAFNAKRWRGRDVTPLYHFEGAWAEKFFDDAEVQGAYVRLREACSDLTDWLAVEGAPVDFQDPDEVEDLRYTIAMGEERSGGWPAVEAAREIAFERAEHLVEERREFEKIGRNRGL